MEFDTVFISDLNDGIFPNERAMSEGKRGVEEERRLAYVAFTRAMRKLYLVEASGFSYILQRGRTTSRFINEIESDHIEHIGVKKQSYDSFGSLQPEQSKMKLPTATPMTNKKSNLKKGDKVTHSKFGEGIVVNCKDGIAQIAFSYPYGVKKIAASHPTLKKL